MRTVSIIGLDSAKSVFQVRGIDAAGEVVIRRQLRRRYVLASFQKLPACLIGHRGVRLITPLVARFMLWCKCPAPMRVAGMSASVPL